MKITPLYDRILVRVLDESDRTKGGLYVPQVARDNTPFLRGEVVAVGDGRITQAGNVVPLSVKAGDIIVFFRAANGEQLVFPTGDEDLLVIREPHVCGILTDLPRATGVLTADGREIMVDPS